MTARILFFLGALALAGSAGLRAQGTVTIDAAGTATPVASGFAGVSVEMSNVGTWAGTYDPAFPALFDSSLVNLLNLLGLYEGPPVVRIGGNSQDRTWLQTSSTASPPAFAYTAAPTLNPITPAQVNGLAWVQRLTGTPFTIGLNMGGNLVSEASAEMASFQSAFDAPGILAFDVGNEPDESDFVSYRPAGWGQAAYQSNLLAFLGPLRSAAPGVVFAAPAVGGSGWLPPGGASGFNALLGALNGQIAFVTAHRYIANGQSPPADPIGDLFQASNSSGIAASYSATQSAAKVFGLGLRMNETNTFYNGGLAGVSNAMASALWVADVLGSYAQAGIIGVNFHGGSSGPYTPFTMTATAAGISVAANPVYYGMMLFAQFIQNGAGLIHATEAGGFPSTASLYASRDGSGALRVLLINKSLTSPATATVTFNNLAGKYQSAGSLILLQAPSISSTSGLTFGGQSYDTGGNVTGAYAPTPVPGSAGTFSWQVPAGTAGLFTLDLSVPVPPNATAQSLAAQVPLGAPAVFTASATGTAPFLYQWLFNGNPLPGATGRRLVLPSAQAANAGRYSVQVTNSAGAVASNIVILAVGAPAITAQPASQTVASGTTVVFTTVAVGLPTPTYQWFFNGAPLAGATSSRLVISGATSANAGAYTCGATNSTGSTTSAPAVLAVTATTTPGRLINLSVNATAGKSQILTVGFVTGGAGTAGAQALLIRATGPALAGLGVRNTLGDPTLTVLSGQTVVAANDNWGTPAANQTAVTAADNATGAFPLTSPGSLDAALAMPLASGAYTVQVSGNTAASGTALAEIYDNTPPNTFSPTTPRLINISANSLISANGAMTAGFVVGGTTAETVLIRVTGPALAALGVPGTVPDPQLTLHTTVGGSDTILASNAGWGGDPQISAIGNAVGAFPLGNAASKDSVLLVTLAPGEYTAVASSVSGVAGIALIEVYEVSASVPAAKKFHPGNYMMLDITSTSAQQRTLIAQNVSDPNILGFQICYTWAQLETSKGNYSGIANTIASDLAYVGQSGKQLVVQIQYKSQNLSDFPAYLQAESNALVQGPGGYYIPNLWDTTMDVRGRYLALLQQIAAACDSSPSLELVNMAESATVDSTATLPAASGYTAQGWVNALQAVAMAAGTAFPTTTFEEYINHITGDDTLVGTACANAIDAGCVFGGPDIDPSRNNIPSYDSYALYAMNHPLGAAVQPMDYLEDGQFWYDSDHSQTTDHLFRFATSSRLHVDYIFWQNSFNDADWQNAKATIDAHPWPWY